MFRILQLIAPDIILTAAHCSESINEAQMGRHNRSDETENYESLIVEKIITHPRYFRNRFLDTDPHDFGVVKLFGQSKKIKPIRINQNPQIPVPDQQMLVSGWGSIDPDDLTAISDVLRGATAYYMTNEECKQFIGNFGGYKVDFQRYVIDATLCARNFEERMDSCRGDSGSGLVVQGREPKEDILVGIVSAGFGCANPTLPALYARVSEVYGWIRDRVCELSLSPPIYFECPAFDPGADHSSTLSSCQEFPVVRDIKLRIESREPRTNITLALLLDSRPEERGWILRSQGERGLWVTEAERPIFFYDKTQPMSIIIETLCVRNDRDYELVLLDSYGDVDVGVQILDEYGNKLLSVNESTSNTGMQFSASFTFAVGAPPSDPPTISSPPSTTMTPTSRPTQIRPFISIVISFDLSPENIGFQLEKLLDKGTYVMKDENDLYELIHVVYPGSFSSDFASATTTLAIPLQLQGKRTEMYRLIMTSNEGRGFTSGGYEVWLGEPSDGNFLFNGDKFYLEETNVFYLEPKATEQPSASPLTLIVADSDAWYHKETSPMTATSLNQSSSAILSHMGSVAGFSVFVLSAFFCTV